jgi:hypothetical protein
MTRPTIHDPTAEFAAIPDHGRRHAFDQHPARPAAIHVDNHQPDPDLVADVRREAIERMTAMNLEHARVAWQRRRRDPIEPYGLALLFTQPEDRPWRGWRYRLTAATRLWLAGTGTRDLPHHLYSFHTGITERLAAPGYDIRSEADRRDDAQADDAEYVGLGVSNLDTDTGSWTDAQRQIDSDRDVAPGRAWIVLVDGTTIRVDRRGPSEFNERTIFTTASLDYTRGNPPYPYRPVEIADMHTDPGHSAVLRWMGELNTAFWQTDRLRMALIDNPTGGRT